MEDVKEVFLNKARPRELNFSPRESHVIENNPAAANRRFDFVFVDVNKKVSREVSGNER